MEFLRRLFRCKGSHKPDEVTEHYLERGTISYELTMLSGDNIDYTIEVVPEYVLGYGGYFASYIAPFSFDLEYLIANHTSIEFEGSLINTKAIQYAEETSRKLTRNKYILTKRYNEYGIEFGSSLELIHEDND